MNTKQTGALAAGLLRQNYVQNFLERQFVELLPEAEAGVRRAICELDAIEDQMSAVRQNLMIEAVGGVRLNAEKAQAALDADYARWSRTLADALSVPVNPFSMKHQAIGTIEGGTIEPW